MPLVLFILFAATSIFAQDSDRNLNQYIQMMNLKGLPKAAAKNEALYQLGFRLFYDKQLSGNDNISCHACHSLGGHSADTLPLAVGEGADGMGEKRFQMDGLLIPRHTPALYNLGLEGVSSLFWDGRIMKHPKGGWWTPEEALNGPEPKLKVIAQTLNGLLAAQSLFPMSSPEEMLGKGSSLSRVEAWEAVMERLFNGRLGASYKRFFREAYPGVEKFNIAHAANALAELERHHFLANNTPWDNYLRGEKKFMTERMKKGAVLFLGKASCTNCHSGEHFSSFEFKSVGIAQIGPGISDKDDKGRMEFTKIETHKYLFRVAPLRNVALTAPYMHTGAFANMWEVIDHYDNPMRSLHHFNWNVKHPRYNEDLLLDESAENTLERIKALSTNLPRMLNLTPDEKKDLYCFLMVGLTDLKNQTDLLNKGVLDEIDDCSPRLTQ